ncbi:MAG: c-type cytochrome [Sphingomonadaceae bacterium]
MPSHPGAGPAPPPPDLGTLLAAADPASGERAAQVCASCHTFDAGGPDRVGPNLNAIVGKPVAGVGGFAYSEALETHGGRWTYELLDEFLARPARAVPGTRMAFAGIRNPRDRANLIAWLASETPSAPPFPAPRPAEAREKDEVASAR